MTDRHDRKHYLNVTLLAGSNKEKAGETLIQLYYVKPYPDSVKYLKIYEFKNVVKTHKDYI